MLENGEDADDDGYHLNDRRHKLSTNAAHDNDGEDNSV